MNLESDECGEPEHMFVPLPVQNLIISCHGTSKASSRSVASRSSGESVSGSYQVVAMTMPIKPFCLLFRFQPKQVVNMMNGGYNIF